MPPRTLPPGSRPAPPTPLNDHDVNQAALGVLYDMDVPVDPSRLHLVALLVEAFDLADPGPGVPFGDWEDLRLALAPLLQATPEQAWHWWTSHPDLTREELEADLAAGLRLAETPEHAMWFLLEITRDRLRAQE